MKLLRLIMLGVLLTGCVVFPVTRTYFEPNTDDGKPERSSSCGYNRAANDSLIRDIDSLQIQVTPSYQEGQHISVTISFRSESGDTEIQPEQITLENQSDGHEYKPIAVKRDVYGPDKSHPYHSVWLHLQYPVMAESLESIKITFPMGTVTRSGLPIRVTPFRFKKTKKSDIFYGSINC